VSAELKLKSALATEESPAEAGLLTLVPLSPQNKNVTNHSDRNQNPKPNVRVGPEFVY
jgi:hypothetical protein